MAKLNPLKLSSDPSTKAIYESDYESSDSDDEQPTDGPVKQPVLESAKQPTDGPVKQPVLEPTGGQVYQLVLEAVKRQVGHEDVAPVKDRKYSCEKCDKDYATEGHYLRHMSKFHNQIKEKIMCDMCNKDFDTRKKKSDHIRRVHNKNTTKYVCTNCTKEYKTKKN